MRLIDRLEEKIKDPEVVRRVRKGVYHLQRRQFIWAGDHGLSGVYDALTHRDAWPLLEDYFEFGGMDLQHNTAEQWIGLMPAEDMVDIMPDERLNGEETLVILMLARVWQMKMNGGEAGYRGVVAAMASEILQQMKDLTKDESVKEARFREILKDLARRSIIAIGEEDEEYFDYQIEIRPIISRFTGVDITSRLASFAAAGTPEIGADALDEDARKKTDEDEENDREDAA